MRDNYLPLLIKVGHGGSYQPGDNYGNAFDTLKKYGLYIKHSPFGLAPKIKNIISQSWLDQDGDDVYIPRAVTYEAYELNLEFVYCKGGEARAEANAKIAAFIQEISGKWLQIYDSYTHQGRQAVYLESFDDDPKFQRRGNNDVIVFTAKFKVNDPLTNIELTEGQ